MTVCLAAIYKVGFPNVNYDGFILAADWQITDPNTNRKSQTGFKLARLSSNVVALGSGDLETFNDLTSKVRLKLRGNSPALTVEETKDCYLWAESVYRQAYLKRHVLFRYEAIKDTFVTPGENTEEEKAYWRFVDERTESVQVPFSTDVIIAGFDGNNARMYKITSQGADDHTNRAYAVIGEGDSVAESEFQKFLTVPYFGKEQTLFQCYVVKKRSEVIASVGDVTGLYIFEPPDKLEVISSKFIKQFDLELKRLEKRHLGNEQKAYARAKEIVRKAEEAGALTSKDGE